MPLSSLDKFAMEVFKVFYLLFSSPMSAYGEVYANKPMLYITTQGKKRKKTQLQ